MDTRALLKGVHTLGLGADYSMPRPLMHLLSRGGKFTVTPRVPLDTQRQATAQAFRDYQRTVRIRIQIRNQRPFDRRYWVPNPTWQPKPASRFVEEQLERLGAALNAARPIRQVSNCSLEERAALQTLARDHNVIVKPADKNLGLTLIARPWYIAECERQLGDAAIYQKVGRVNLAGIQNQLISLIAAMPPAVVPTNHRKWLLAQDEAAHPAAAVLRHAQAAQEPSEGAPHRRITQLVHMAALPLGS